MLEVAIMLEGQNGLNWSRGRTLEELRQRGIIAGSAGEVKEQLQKLEESGLQRIMLQWLDLDDLEGLEALAKAVI